MPFLGTLGGLLWGSRARAELVNSNQNSGDLVRSRKCIRHTGAGRQERLVYKGCWGSHIRNLHLLVSVAAMCLHEGSRVSLRPLQATWPNIMDAQPAKPWNSLAELCIGCRGFPGEGE